ncbi:MAG: hypothetical protein K5989_04065 [Lachnospiraceae bacterium]|nr:hypothetical protein [Lachnospiraceae bacterium]
MTNILMMRDQLKQLYGKYELYITPALKFLLALITYLLINHNIGYMDQLKNPVLMIMVAFINSILPVNAILVIAAMFTVLHIYKLSLICAAVILLLFILLFFLYFRFAPKDGIGVLLTPLAFLMHIPYAVPLCLGIKGNIFSVVSVVCGVIVHYTLDFVMVNSSSFSDVELEAMIPEVRGILNGILENQTMRVMALAFAVTVVVICLLRRLSLNYSRIIALSAGALVNIVIILVGDLKYDLNLSIVGVIFGTLFSLLIAIGMEFFIFSVDYSRTEYLQFEDDEYYFYVKAVPKLTVAAEEKTVKQIVEPRSPVDRKGKNPPKEGTGGVSGSGNRKSRIAPNFSRKTGDLDVLSRKDALKGESSLHGSSGNGKQGSGSGASDRKNSGGYRSRNMGAGLASLEEKTASSSSRNYDSRRDLFGKSGTERTSGTSARNRAGTSTDRGSGTRPGFLTGRNDGRGTESAAGKNIGNRPSSYSLRGTGSEYATFDRKGRTVRRGAGSSNPATGTGQSGSKSPTTGSGNRL